MWGHFIYFPAVLFMVLILYRSFLLILVPLEHQKLRLVQMLELRIALALGIFLVITPVSSWL